MEKLKLLKPLHIILTVLTIIILIEGVLCIELRNNYVSLHSSQQETQADYTQLQDVYDELQSSLQDLNSSYLKLLNYYFGEYGAVTVEQAATIIEDNSELVIVDVRTLAEYSEGHIEGSINVCVGCDPTDILNYLMKEDEILLYCESGYRSAIAMRILFENGYSTVFNLQGGIVAWKNAGLPVIEGS